MDERKRIRTVKPQHRANNTWGGEEIPYRESRKGNAASLRIVVAKVAETFEPVHDGKTPRKSRNPGLRDFVTRPGQGKLAAPFGANGRLTLPNQHNNLLDASLMIHP